MMKPPKSLPSLLIILSFLMLNSSTTEGFTTTSYTTATVILSSPHHQRRPLSFQTNNNNNNPSYSKLDAIPELSSSLLSFDFENLVYSAQSTAASIASDSMQMSTSSSSMMPSLIPLYFAGLLTSVSLCSMGLLPLTVSYISTAAGEREDKAVLFPTIAFALGLASVFCGLGISAALFGSVFGSSNNGSASGFWNALVLGTISGGISIAMGLQLLELVQLPLPSFDFGTTSFDDDGGGDDTKDNENGGLSALIRTFLLGGSSALVASPCATPVLTSILAFVAASQDPILGSILLFTYTIGYSTPLVLVGASGSQALLNAGTAAMTEEDSSLGKIGSLVTPFIASILIWYGTNQILVTFLGDPSLAGLAPVLE